MMPASLRSLIQRCCLGLIAFSCLLGTAPAQQYPTLATGFNDEQAAAMAKLAIKGIDQEYPNKPSNVMAGPEGVLSPKAMHPAFYGCFDWHSSVHGHWMLVRLLRQNPNHPLAAESRSKLDAHLTAEAIAAETAYYEQKENKSFERMYGWAWLLRLSQELEEWPEDADARRWRANIRPLEDRIVTLTMEYLPKLTWPIRTGVHPDTGFALGMTLDYARSVKNQALADLVESRAKHFYGSDKNYNDAFEPSGEDFFSTSLNEADLMRRVLAPDNFAEWLTEFVPGLIHGNAKRLLTPVEVSDVTDGKLVHLAGLNLSRAWTLRGIAGTFPKDSPIRSSLDAAAEQHLAAGLKYVFSGHYEGEHWLGTFAVYAITSSGTPLGNSQEVSRWEPKPDRPEFARFEPIRAPQSTELLLRTGDRIAIVGDSITEQKMYSRLIENYLTVCVPQYAVSVRQYGWSGERCDGFLGRMNRDCLSFQPTLATICYGMNDSRYVPYTEANGADFRKNLTEIVARFQKADARVVVGSPGCAGKLASWVQSRSGTLEDHNLHLCQLRNIGIEVAVAHHAAFADIFWPMYQAQWLAKEQLKLPENVDYQVAGKDGIHPGWAGQTIMAFAFLQALGLDGEIAKIEMDLANGDVTASVGHVVKANQAGQATIESSRYPICVEGTIDDDNSLASGMQLVPFHDKLNRFDLIVKNATAPKYRVQWGEQSKVFSKDELARGVNLAKEFVANPFSAAYKKVDERVLAKQSFETKQVKELFAKTKTDEEFQNVVASSERERGELVLAIRKAFVPVEHSIQVVAIDQQ
jgi:lysophospholipase L1-like esterase